MAERALEVYTWEILTPGRVLRSQRMRGGGELRAACP